MVFDHTLLKRRILFLFGSCAAFAKEIGEKPEWLSRRITGITQISADEMILFAEKLDIKPTEFYDYFFTPKVR